MRFTRIVPILGAAIVLVAPTAQGQTCAVNPCTVTNTASAMIGELLQLTLAGADPTVLTPPVVTDFSGDEAFKTNTGPQATVRSNVPWTVTVEGAAGVWTGGSGSKPASDLAWHPASAPNAYAQDMSSADPLFDGGPTGGASETILYRTRWDITTDSPGTYTLVVNFTLSAP